VLLYPPWVLIKAIGVGGVVVVVPIAMMTVHIPETFLVALEETALVALGTAALEEQLP
jgi:hypothetical protein